MDLLTTAIFSCDVYSFTCFCEIENETDRLISCLPSLGHFHIHIVKVETGSPMNSIAMPCHEWHSPGAAWVLLVFEGNN